VVWIKTENMSIAEGMINRSENNEDDWLDHNQGCITGDVSENTVNNAVEEVETDVIGNPDDGEVHQIKELTNNDILLYLRENELAKMETKRLESLGMESETGLLIEVKKLMNKRLAVIYE
jgi:hypothetical protein